MSLKPGEVENLIGMEKLPHISIKKYKLWEDQKLESASDNQLKDYSVINLDPDDIIKYKYKDRPENELGDLEEFAKTLKAVGQLQPGIVRPSKIIKDKYELIVGERRWRACKIAGLKFQAKIIPYNDTEAGLAQAAENNNRKNLSEYARGLSYSKQIEDGVLTQSDLAEKLGTTRQQISRLLAYREIPKELISAIGDMTKVSPRTAEEIKFICKKDSTGMTLLLTLAEKIGNGIGHASLRKNYEIIKNNGANIITNKPVYYDDGRHLFSWKKDGNGNLSISFPKGIRDILSINEAEPILKEAINESLKASLSPRGDRNENFM